ncbi:hypothetical protein DENSPDRAFT_840975 [Dentipellis sp. KUC8613]|nr:hypothetical protein DENSPDRAFT_840975 [Dentipellis sp. KUC8613]
MPSPSKPTLHRLRSSLGSPPTDDTRPASAAPALGTPQAAPPAENPPQAQAHTEHEHEREQHCAPPHPAAKNPTPAPVPGQARPPLTVALVTRARASADAPWRVIRRVPVDPSVGADRLFWTDPGACVSASNRNSNGAQDARSVNAKDLIAQNIKTKDLIAQNVNVKTKDVNAQNVKTKTKMKTKSTLVSHAKAPAAKESAAPKARRSAAVHVRNARGATRSIAAASTCEETQTQTQTQTELTPARAEMPLLPPRAEVPGARVQELEGDALWGLDPAAPRREERPRVRVGMLTNVRVERRGA